MKKENILYIIITILLIIISSGVTYYVVSNKSNNNDSNIENNNNGTNKDNDTKKEEKITLSDNELSEYLSYTLDLADIISSDTTTANINTTDKIYILGNALAQINENEYEEKKEKYEASYDYQYSDINGNSTYYYISETKIEPLLKKMYNLELKDFNLKEDHSNYVGAFDGTCYYYFKQGFSPSGCAGSIEKLSKIDSYEANNEELIIYEYAAGLDAGNQIFDYYTHKTIDMNKYDEEAAREYFKKHYTEFNKYKHTYKKNDTGYYWYQTEMVK